MRGVVLILVTCALLWWWLADRRSAPCPGSRFQTHFASTFTHAGCTAGTVRAMFAERARALKELGELAMRMPNDPPAEERLAAYTRRMDAHMMRRIEDARQRCNSQLLHPGPVNDAWYGQWYRPANQQGDVRHQVTLAHHNAHGLL